MRRWAVLLLTLAAVLVLTNVAATAGSNGATSIPELPSVDTGGAANSSGRGLHQARQPRTVVFESFLHGG